MTETPSSEQAPGMVKRPRSEPAQFEALFRQHIAYLCRTLRRFGVPDKDVEDVAHDVFVVVHQRLEDYDAQRPFRPWLCGIASRTASAHRRLKGNQTASLDFEQTAPEGSSHETRDLLSRVLPRLPEDRLAVLVMHDMNGHTMPEIADALAIPLNTAYSRLRLARSQAREHLDRWEKGAGA